MQMSKPFWFLLSTLALNSLLVSCHTTDAVKLPQGCQFDAAPLSQAHHFTAMIQHVAKASKQGTISTHNNWDAPRVTGELLVIGDPINPRMSAQASTLLSKIKPETIFRGLQRVKTPAGKSDQAFAKQLETAGLTVQPNYIYHAMSTPNDPGMPGGTGITVNQTQINQTYLTRILAPQAWNYLESKHKKPIGVSMAILDSQIDREHVDLKARNINSVNCITDVKDAYGQFLTSTPAHGTPVTGIMVASTNNKTGVAGLTWGGSVLGVEVLGQDSKGVTLGSTATVTKGLLYAMTKGVKVVNLSLGAEVDPTQGPDKLLTAALNEASKKAVIIAAAGNESGKKVGVFFPASHPKVIAVGALGKKDGEPACYNSMPTIKAPRPIDLYAPGGAFTCEGADPIKDGTLMLAPNNLYASESGTSLAAPQASAVAALMWAANPSLSPKEIKDKLLNSSRVINNMRHLNAEQALKSVLE